MPPKGGREAPHFGDSHPVRGPVDLQCTQLNATSGPLTQALGLEVRAPGPPRSISDPQVLSDRRHLNRVSLGLCCFKVASTAGLEAIQVVFLNETSRPSSARAPKRALATRRPFAATCWGLDPQKSTDRSSTHVSAVATAFWLSTLLHAGQSATLLRATAKGQPASIPLLAKAGGPINPSAVKSLGPL